MNRKRELYAAGTLLAIAAVLVAGLFTIQQRVQSFIGPRFMPILVIIALVLCAIWIAIPAIQSKKTWQETPKTPSPEGANKQAGNDEAAGVLDVLLDRHGTITMWVLLVLYALCLQSVGFIPCSMVLIFGMCLLLAPKSERYYGRFAILATVSSVVIYFVFVKLFFLILPKGILAGIL